MVLDYQIPWTDLSEESLGSCIAAYLKRERAIERTDLRIAILRKSWSRQGRILDAIKTRGRA